MDASKVHRFRYLDLDLLTDVDENQTIALGTNGVIYEGAIASKF